MAGKKRASNSVPSPLASQDERASALDHIAEALRGLQFGHLTVLVQDGVVIQIERTEKRRLR
ncbi:MAG: YezD family protein [Planctomycetaceae bacterium]|nr:YezD family protein [Planctomycetaceae bacterium]